MSLNQVTPMGSLLRFKQKLNALAFDDMKMPTCVWEDPVGQPYCNNFRINGHKCSITGIRAGVRATMDECWRMYGSVSLGILKGMEVDLGDLHDRLPDETPGYSFLYDARNVCFEGRERYMWNKVSKAFTMN